MSWATQTFYSLLEVSIDGLMDKEAKITIPVVQLKWILGSSQTAEGMKALAAKSLSLSRTSLCHEITRPPFLHSRACQMLNFCPHPSQFVGRSFGVLAYLSRRLSQNSCADSSVPFMVEGITDSHCPVSWPLRIVLRSSHDSLSDHTDLLVLNLTNHLKKTLTTPCCQVYGILFAHFSLVSIEWEARLVYMM